MAQPRLVISGACFQGGGAFLMARVPGWDGNAIVQADISSISYRVFDVADINTATSTAIISGGQTVSSVVFDTLQTDSRWTMDDTGYNFGVQALASWFPLAHRYAVEFKFTPASGPVFWVVFEVGANRIRTLSD